MILDGSQATGNCTGIVIFTAGNVIRGLQFQNFSGLGVALFRKSGNIIGGSREIGAGPNGEGNVFIRCGGVSLSGYTVMDNIVAGNNIGIAADGVTPSGNDDGIELREYAARNVIGIDAPGYGNLIGANRNNGVSSMGSAYGNLIEGNTVGTDITGTLNRGNDTNGISFELGGSGRSSAGTSCAATGARASWSAMAEQL